MIIIIIIGGQKPFFTSEGYLSGGLVSRIVRSGNMSELQAKPWSHKLRIWKSLLVINIKS